MPRGFEHSGKQTVVPHGNRKEEALPKIRSETVTGRANEAVQGLVPEHSFPPSSLRYVDRLVTEEYKRHQTRAAAAAGQG